MSKLVLFCNIIACIFFELYCYWLYTNVQLTCIIAIMIIGLFGFGINSFSDVIYYKTIEKFLER